MAQLAVKTLAAIAQAIEADQGATYRRNLGKVLPHISDAYRDEPEGHRTHLGASVIGGECARKIWYGFRWVEKPSFSGQMLRLFNRGHLEEGRFIAILLTIGVQIFQQDAEGKQFRISELGGHFGGSGDGVGIGIPDLDPTLPCLLEFKTHNDKSFEGLKKNGVRSAKFEHYVQMQCYLRKMGLTVALYMAVNKNNDELYGEIVLLDTATADKFLDRGRQIVMLQSAPRKINESSAWYACQWCDFKKNCHFDKVPERNCRTCEFSYPDTDGTWRCESLHSEFAGPPLDKERQHLGCDKYAISTALK